MLFSRARADWVRDTPRARRTVVLCSGHARGMPILSYSSPLLSAARAERERRGLGTTGRHRDMGEVHARGGAKADGSGMRGRPDTRVRPDVRTLATPFNVSCQRNPKVHIFIGT
jgi:hypothetical protein